MTGQNEINRAIAYLKKKEDPISEAQIYVLERKKTEQWAFERYVKGVPEEQRNEALFFAARDAAQFLTGKISITAICPDLEESDEEESGTDINTTLPPKEDNGETITLSRKEYEELLQRIERVERRLGLKSQKNRLSRKLIKNVNRKDLMSQTDACRYIGCGKSTIKRWADKGYLTGYKDGQRIFYDKKEIDNSVIVKEHRLTVADREKEYGTDN